MTSSDLWPLTFDKRNAIVHVFQADFFNNARTVWPRTTNFGRITHVGCITSGSATPCRKGAGPKTRPNTSQFRVFLFYAYALWRIYQISRGNTCGKGPCFRGQPRLHRKGAGSISSAPQFWWFLSISAYIAYHLSQNHNIWRGNTCRPVSRGHSRLSPQESWVPALPNFGVLLYLCLHPLMHNGQKLDSNNFNFY